MKTVLSLFIFAAAMTSCEKSSKRPSDDKKQTLEVNAGREAYATERVQEFSKLMDAMAVVSSPIEQKMKGFGLTSDNSVEMKAESNPFTLTSTIFTEMGIGRVDASSEQESFLVEFESKSGTELVEADNHIYVRVEGDLPGGKITSTSYLNAAFVLIDKVGKSQVFYFYRYGGSTEAEMHSNLGSINFNEVNKFFDAAAKLGMKKGDLEVQGILNVVRSEEELTIKSENLGWSTAASKVTANALDINMSAKTASVRSINIDGEATSATNGSVISSVKIVGSNIGKKDQQLKIDISSKTK